MDHSHLSHILEKLYHRSMSVDDALEELRDLPFSDLGFAMVDHHRTIRKGYPEVIFCQCKTPEQVVQIAKVQIDHEETVFGTRANEAVLQEVAASIDGVEIDRLGFCFWKKIHPLEAARDGHRQDCHLCRRYCGFAGIPRSAADT